MSSSGLSAPAMPRSSCQQNAQQSLDAGRLASKRLATSGSAVVAKDIKRQLLLKSALRQSAVSYSSSKVFCVDSLNRKLRIWSGAGAAAPADGRGHRALPGASRPGALRGAGAGGLRRLPDLLRHLTHRLGEFGCQTGNPVPAPYDDRMGIAGHGTRSPRP